MEIPGDSGQSEPGSNASWWPTDFMEKLQSVSLSPREETLSDRGSVGDVDKAELSSQNASQVLWSTGTLSSPIPNGFYSIIPDKKLKELFDTIPSPDDLYSLGAEGLKADIILVDAVKDKKLSMLKQLSAALVKGLSTNPALLIKKIAGLVFDFYKRPNPELSPAKAAVEDLSHSIENRGIQLLGQIRHGSCRPCAILFKVLADSVGLESKLMVGLPSDGSVECADSYKHMSVVVTLNSVELLVDLMRFPGQLIPFSTKAIFISHISAAGESDSAENDSCDSPLEPNSPLCGFSDRTDGEGPEQDENIQSLYQRRPEGSSNVTGPALRNMMLRSSTFSEGKLSVSHSEPNITNAFWRRSRRKAVAEQQRTASSRKILCCIMTGLIVGGLANISNTETNTRTWFNFHEEFFFLFLLPPIIFQSGFSLAPKPFFSNFGAIVTFAIFGTFIASIVTGILVYLGGLMFLMYRLPLVECLMFGALISATDPVTVLSIFQELGNDMNLYALVFGESVLNDAMAISLYRTMSSVRSQASGLNFFMLVVKFLETFVGSMSAGVGVGFTSALLFKYAGLDIDNLHNLECCLFVLFPYFSYMLAEGLGLSGIVSILFTGIVMKHYTFSNLSEDSQRFSTAFFHLISSLAETFVFIYMGFDIAMEQHSWSHIGFIFFSILFIGVARAANVFSCAYLVNLVRPANRKIPLKHQKALWYSGLRGAMAFALALQSVHDLPDGHGQTILTATTAIVVLTVLLIGGSTGNMLEALEVVGDGLDVPLGESFEENNGYISPSYEEGTSSGSRLKMRLKEFQKSTASFTALDKNYLTPFFTSQNDEDGSDEEIQPIMNARRGLRNDHR